MPDMFRYEAYLEQEGSGLSFDRKEKGLENMAIIIPRDWRNPSLAKGQGKCHSPHFTKKETESL